MPTSLNYVYSGIMGLASKLGMAGASTQGAPGAAAGAPTANGATPSAPPLPQHDTPQYGAASFQTAYPAAATPMYPSVYPQQPAYPPYQQQQQQQPAYGMPVHGGSGLPSYAGGSAAPAACISRPAGAAAATGAGNPQAVGTQSILARLQTIVLTNSLQRFYPPQQLDAVAQRVARIDFHELAARWRMPVELALDFAALALYDIILYCDDSGSMAFEDGGERIEDLKVILGRVAEVATLFDDDGILVRFMNSSVEGNGIRSAADASALLSQVRFGGTTPLAASMRTRVLERVVYAAAAGGQLAKPVLVITITDGEPTDTPRDAILQVIREARARLSPRFGPKAAAFQFAQVGRDSRAQAFLGRLDKDASVGDIIDCTSYFEQEAEEFARKGLTLSVEAWLLKLMLGAIDPSYDAEDEG